MQNYFNKTKFFNEINGFYQRIKLKAHFKDQTNKPKAEEDIFRKPTDKTWIPQKNHHTIETFIEATNNEINKEIAHIKPPKYSNLSKLEQEALEDLQEKDDIVIVNADKGGAVIIMDVTDYTEKAKRQLNNNKHYPQLSKDQTATNNEIVNNVIERFQKENLITKSVAEGLKTISPWTPKFCIQPKIHKQGNTGRPVISSVNCHTSNNS